MEAAPPLVEIVSERDHADSPTILLGGAATCSEGFLICFLKVPLACLGSMEAAVQPNGLGNSQKTVYKIFGTNGRPT